MILFSALTANLLFALERMVERDPRITNAAAQVENRLRWDTNPETRASDALRIAICLQELEPLARMLSGKTVADGTYIVQGSLVQGLQSRGHNLTFLAPRDLHEVEYRTDVLRPRIVTRTWTASRGFRLTAKCAWRFQKMVGLPYLNVFSNYRLYDACLQCLPGRDVVYERNGLYNMGVAMACKKLRLPYVVFFEADQLLEHAFMGKPITGLLRWRATNVLRYNLAAADRIITVSEAAKTHLVKTWQVPAEKVVVYPNGVDVKRFRPLPELRAQVRTDLELNSGPLIVFVGSFFEWHDTATLLDAFAQVIRIHPTAHLVLVGDGHRRPAMMERAKALEVAHAVKFIGLIPHSQVPPLLSAADIAVAPYPKMSQELWLSPLKVFEYMASGTALVGSQVGQVAQIIRDGINGFLVPPGDASALAKTLRLLIEDPALRARIGKQAREDAVQQHSWENYVVRMEQLFREVISSNSVYAN